MNEFEASKDAPAAQAAGGETPKATFADLGLSAEILRAIEDSGYSSPTPIQEKAIPKVLEGRDVLGIAQTGTGKTGAFTIPMIEILSRGRAKARMPRTLILEPTRELAAQVEREQAPDGAAGERAHRCGRDAHGVHAPRRRGSFRLPHARESIGRGGARNLR